MIRIGQKRVKRGEYYLFNGVKDEEEEHGQDKTQKQQQEEDQQDQWTTVWTSLIQFPDILRTS